LGGEYLSISDVRTLLFNELSDSLVLGTAAGGAGAVRYVRLNIENEPAVVTIAAPAAKDETTPAPKPPKKGPKVESAGRKPGDVVEVPIAEGVTMKFCWVPAGTATLGSPVTEKDRNNNEKEHEFTTKGFWLGKYAVTQAEWTVVMGRNPSNFSTTGARKNQVAGIDTSRCPVEQVSWNDCQDFLETLNEKIKIPSAMGKGRFALPHEDEWEYACRGSKGNKQPFYFGNELNGTQANCRGDVPYGTTIKGRNLGFPTPVGSYERIAPHLWGLSDMHGNVWQ
jgi:formylglycine-generating enzyme required for sulfatase activity